MISSLSLRGRLLAGFLAVAVLTGGIGLFANWQFTRVGAVTQKSLGATISGMHERERSEALAFERTTLLQHLEGAPTAAEVERVINSPEWQRLLASPEFSRDLKAGLTAQAESHFRFLSAREKLATDLAHARSVELSLRDRLLPALKKIADEQAEQTKKVSSEVEQARADTIANLFLNFDATMNLVSLVLETQSALFKLEQTESNGAPAPALRSEIAARLENNPDPAALRLVGALKAPPPAGQALGDQHKQFFDALSEQAANVVFNGRTTVVMAATESINTMGERTDATQAAARLLEDQRTALESGLQKVAGATSGVLQSVSQVYGEPVPDRMKPLMAERETLVRRLAEEREAVEKSAAALGIPWVGEALAELHRGLLEGDESLLAAAARLVGAREKLEAADAQLADCLRTESERMREASRAFVESGQADAAAVAAISATARRWIGLLSLAAAALALVLAVVFAHRIARSLRRIADGLSASAKEVSSAAHEMSASSDTIARDASNQAASIEETAASLLQIERMAKQNSESAAAARMMAKTAREATEHGALQMDEMVAAMSAIRSSSDNIAKIIKTIDEIAFQTNILALNAAVEAARAGQAGAGFAVVADEVRALAQRAAEAARDTAGRIEDSIQKSRHGEQLSHDVAATLLEIKRQTIQVNDVVEAIAKASSEQTQGFSQINASVSHIDDFMQKAAANTEESASAAVELTAQARSLTQSSSTLVHMVDGGRASAWETKGAGVVGQEMSSK